MAHGITAYKVHVAGSFPYRLVKVINHLGGCFALIVKTPSGLGNAVGHLKAPATGNIIGTVIVLHQFKSPLFVERNIVLYAFNNLGYGWIKHRLFGVVAALY